MRTVLAYSLVFLALTSCNCTRSPVPEDKPLPSETPRPFPKELKEFVWHKVNIQIGMKKTALLEHIGSVGPFSHTNRYGIRLKSPESSDTWDLSYGNPTGAAPGGGVIRVVFEKEKVRQIVFMGAYR
jgi:hypothetical protein